MATCFECDAPADHWHHVIPRVLGGTRTIPLCENCHGKVHSRDMTGHRQLTKAAMEAKRAKGERVGTIPYGYQLGADGKTLEINEEERKVVVLIHTLREQGLSLRAIAQELETRGIRTRSNTSWQTTQVVRSLLTEKWHPMRVYRVLTGAGSKYSQDHNLS